MCSLLAHLSPFAATSTDNSTTCLTCSRLEERFLILSMFSWVTTSTEDTTQSKHSPTWCCSKRDTQALLLFSGETTRLDKLQRCMDSTMKSWENTEMPTPGSIAQRFSTTLASVQSLKAAFSVCTPVCRLILRPLTKSDFSNVASRSPTKDPSATLCGQTLSTSRTGLYPQEALVGSSAAKSLLSSTI